MCSYEFEKARQDLATVRDTLYQHLITSYHKEKDSKASADSTFKYLESVIDNVIKRKKYYLSFHGGGSATWHSTVFELMGSWVEAETRLNSCMSEELDKIIEM